MLRKLLYILLSVVLLYSCTRENLLSGPGRVRLSVDSLSFDTVFTSTGSITKSFKIVNDNNQKLVLSSVALMGGNNSFFNMNVDGISGKSVNNIEIEAHDSLYVFVSVSIDPNGNNQPFLIEDSILIRYNQGERKLPLQAWGQNAHFLRDVVIVGNEIWTNDLPYVILGGIQVDTGASLTILQGCQIYLHANAPFIVDGTLLVNGTKSDSVVFRGDRLDEGYREFPGSWPGIYFRGESTENILTYVHVKNAYQGIVLNGPSTNSVPKLTLQECIIENIFDAGILSINSSVYARNSLILNCGNNFVAVYGGNYQFDHCTVASFSTSYLSHKNPVLIVNDFVVDGSVSFTAPLDAVFNNCIFWGDDGMVKDEIIVLKEGNDHSVRFNHCLYKTETDLPHAVFVNSIKNQNPLFEKIDINKREFNLRLQPGSPAINAGANLGISFDLDNLPRNLASPDIGCYESQ